MKSFCESLISASNAKEAREWLQSGGKRGFTLGVLDSTKESLALVEKAYASGAVRVTAVEIDEYPDMGGTQNTGKLVIELPDAASKRAKVLAWGSKIAEKQGFDALTDTGERYFFLMLD
ncbi:MAG TPA: hypothetical protein VHX90_07695 [Verrucomicrobiae bacterium]|jgi:hypothetical protein|nr:hypothetical protein [Verrucomicrobiae bacterium]